MRLIAWGIITLALAFRSSRSAAVRVRRLIAEGAGFSAGDSSQSTLIAWLISALCAFAGVGVAHAVSSNLAMVAYAFFLATLVELSMTDMDTHLLPRTLVNIATFWGLIVLGLAAFTTHRISAFPSMLAGSVLMWCVLWLLRLVSRGDLGKGDVALAGLLGLYVGWQGVSHVVYALFFSLVAGGILGVITLVITRDRKRHIPFGPALSLGAVAALIWGHYIGVR
jgi:leader peptidase (prepilin peptidase)/N-methyltransferase